jgi:hypothetical protein
MEQFMALLRGGGLRARLVGDVLVLSDGSRVKTFAVRDVLKAGGCAFDPGTKTWRRQATEAQRAVVDGGCVKRVCVEAVGEDAAGAVGTTPRAPTYERAWRAHGARLLSMAPVLGSDGAPNWPEFVWPRP